MQINTGRLYIKNFLCVRKYKDKWAKDESEICKILNMTVKIEGHSTRNLFFL